MTPRTVALAYILGTAPIGLAGTVALRVLDRRAER